MSLSNVSPGVLGIAWLLLAGVLFGLQFLRVRHRRQEVVTVLFWQEAIEESRARVFVRRFRHPWAYVLFMGIGSAILLAWAGLKSDREAEKDWVLLVDGSAGMSWGQRFDQSEDALKQQIDAYPKGARRVFWCGADRQLLLDRGEESVLLGERLLGLEPEATVSGFERACVFLAAEARERQTEIVLFGDAPVSSEVTALLPDHVSVRRAAALDRGKTESRGIRALGVASSSESYESVDVYIRLNSGAVRPVFQLGGEPYEGEVRSLSGEGEWLLPVVPARGALFSVSLADGDDVVADDSASIRLPLRERIRVQVNPGLPVALQRLIDDDPSIELVVDAPEVTVGMKRPGVPSLTWVPDNGESEAFSITLDDIEDDINEVLMRLGMGQIDGTALADATGKVIRVATVPGEVREVQFWDELLTTDYNFTDSMAFPLFVIESLRWLGGREPIDPYVHVGAEHPHLLAAGASYSPPRVGLYEDREGVMRAASLVSDPLNLGPGSDDLLFSKGDGVPQPDRRPSWTSIFILLALALLIAEWRWFQQGRLP